MFDLVQIFYYLNFTLLKDHTYPIAPNYCVLRALVLVRETYRGLRPHVGYIYNVHKSANKSAMTLNYVKKTYICI